MAGKPNLTHLLRAMKPGDVIYLPETGGRLDRQITSVVYRNGGKAETAYFLATNLNPSTAHRIVRVKMIRPLENN